MKPSEPIEHQSTATQERSRWRTAVASFLPPVLPLVVVLASIEAAVQFGLIAPYIIPPPSRIFASIRDDRVELFSAMLNTSIASLVGFVLSMVIGVVLAVVLASSAWIQRAFYPYAIFFQTVPIVAIAPLLVIWFGYGMPTAVASAFIVSVFPVIANALAGLLSTDPALRDLFRLYGATPTATLLKLRLPGALPNILTGLRIAGGLAVIGAIVGEFIGGNGSLGDVITSALTQQKNAKVFAAVLLASLLGLALFGLINLVSRLALRHWHASER
ncbi:ABC transporter permease [Humisphaera borealis]|uniref:ABC transporter permease n=1 Tax=Humisphaera borealis TaxID=2807512 RepID=UPI0019CFF44D|nr:ABC transporter permease [Humisphaera borealis]